MDPNNGAQRDVPVATMSSREVEAGLDQFLNGFRGSGEEASCGAVLVKSLPSSRLRKCAPQTLSPRHPFSVGTAKATKISRCPNAYRIETRQRDETIHWLAKEETLAEGASTWTQKDLTDKMQGGGELGAQCLELRSTPQGLRQGLQINTFPISAPDPKFREMCQEAGAQQIYGSYITIGTGGSVIPVRKAFANTTTIYFHHRGSPRRWIIIPPSAQGEFEEKMRKELCEGSSTSTCSQFARHMKLWIEPAVLRSWGIQFLEVTQHAHELLFLFPGSYFYGFSQGLSIVESKLHGGARWAPGGYKYCNADEATCAGDNLLADFATPSSAESSSKKTTPAPRGKRRHTSDPPTSPGGGGGKRAAKQRRVPASSGAPEGSNGVQKLTPTRPPVDSPEFSDQGTVEIEEGAKEARDAARSIRGASGGGLAGESNEPFNISDDEGDDGAVAVDSVDSRIFQLQQENAAILRDLAMVRSERDALKARKNLYKSRLLERESLIESLKGTVGELQDSLEVRVKETERDSWREMLVIVQQRIGQLESG